MLPESEADRIALVLGEPVSRTGATDLRSGTNIVAGGCKFPIKTPSLIQSWDTAGPRRTDCGHNKSWIPFSWRIGSFRRTG